MAPSVVLSVQIHFKIKNAKKKNKKMIFVASTKAELLINLSITY